MSIKTGLIVSVLAVWTMALGWALARWTQQESVPRWLIIFIEITVLVAVGFIGAAL
jgi:hypothetical protein